MGDIVVVVWLFVCFAGVELVGESLIGRFLLVALAYDSVCSTGSVSFSLFSLLSGKIFLGGIFRFGFVLGASVLFNGVE